MTTKIKMKVNEKRLIATMKDAFTNDYSVITEMAQNGRRAGATEVTFRVSGLSKEEKKAWGGSRGDSVPFHMEIIDNGAGITDMQDLISVASSGWDAETVENENPFGMGFLIAIYSSEGIEVNSRGKKFTASKKQLLELEDITVVPCDVITGTSISLKNIALKNVASLEELKDLMWNLLSGFPIDVNLEVKDYGTIECVTPRYSVKTLEAPGSKYVKYAFPEADLYLLEDYLKKDSYNSSPAALPIFQGLIVEKLKSGYGYMHDRNNISSVQLVAHLKDSIGSIRLPDRDSFVNNSDVVETLSKLIKQVVLKQIMSFKDDYDTLVRNIGLLKNCDCLHLLNAHDKIPESYISLFWEANVSNSNNQSEGSADTDWLLNTGPRNFTKTTSDDFVVIDTVGDLHEAFDIWEGDRNNFALAFALHESEVPYVLLDSSNMHKDHWALENAIPMADLVGSISIDVEDISTPVLSTPGYAESAIKFCSSFNISFEANGERHYTGAVTNTYCLCNFKGSNVSLYPNKCSSSHVVVDSTCFQDEYNYDETGERLACSDFSKWLELERCNGDPAKLIAKYLEDADLAAFEGHEFRLVIKNKEVLIETFEKGA